MSADPLSVECYQCDARVGERCWSGTRRGMHLQRGSHEVRAKLAAGEKVQEPLGRWMARMLRKQEVTR